MKQAGGTAAHSTRPGMRLLLLFLLLTAAATAAPAGVVETLDGRTWNGRLQLVPDGAIQVVPSNAPVQFIALTNLARADFSSPTEEPLPRSGSRLKATALDESRGALPAPWRNRDIGKVETGGDATHYRGTFTVAGGHRERRGHDDGFHFVYQSFRGDGEIVARVASVEPRDQKERQARAGVLMRASLDPESPSVLMSVSGGLGTYFRKWGQATEVPAQDRQAASNPPYWVKLVRQGTRFAGYQSTDGRAWRLLAETTAPMPPRLFVGLAMINSRKGEMARASFDHVALGAATTAGRFVSQVVLGDGTIIADSFKSVDNDVVTFSKDKPGLAVRTDQVARLLFQEVEEPQFPPPGRTGLLQRNGDFVDGDFRGLIDGHVKISSVLFGHRSYEFKSKIAAVVLGKVTPQPIAFEVKTLDGSRWRAKSLAIEAGAVRVTTPFTGTSRIPMEELLEIQRSGARN